MAPTRTRLRVTTAELAEFMGFLAGRYAGRVQAYEVWNEPNLHWAWPSGPDPGEYAQMLRAVAPSIRAADPAAKVIFGGLSRNDYEYVAGVYAAMPDIGKYFDVMATHPYVYYGLPPEAVWPARRWQGLQGCLLRVPGGARDDGGAR